VFQNTGDEPWSEKTRLILHTRGEHAELIKALFDLEIEFDMKGVVCPGDVATATIRMKDSSLKAEMKIQDFMALVAAAIGRPLSAL